MLGWFYMLNEIFMVVAIPFACSVGSTYSMRSSWVMQTKAVSYMGEIPWRHVVAISSACSVGSTYSMRSSWVMQTSAFGYMGEFRALEACIGYILRRRGWFYTLNEIFMSDADKCFSYIGVFRA